MNNYRESTKKMHAKIMAEIAVGLIVDHGDLAGIVFADDSPHCQCDDCIELPELPDLGPGMDDEVPCT